MIIRLRSGVRGKGSLVLGLLISLLFSLSCLESSEPVPPGQGDIFTQVAVGEDHSCALQGDGRVHCWGENDDGQLNVPEGARFSQITAGYRFSCGIQRTGRIACWGSNAHNKIEAPEGRFTTIDAGWDHACALGSDGPVCWGWAADRRTTSPTDIVFTAIGAGAEHSCGLTKNGDLLCWGKNDNGRADSHSGPFASLAVGIAHTCVLQSDGRAFCQGENAAGQSDPPDTVFMQITAGSDHSCGVLPNGALQCWGGARTNVSNVHNHQLIAPEGAYSSISAGWRNTCAVNAQGHAECWEYAYQAIPFPPYDRLNFEDVLPGYKSLQPTEVFPWPAGGLAVAEKSGSIVAYAVDSEPIHILDLTDRTNSDGPEDGLLSAALDPEFSDYPFLYVFYTTPDESNEYGTSTRLARFPIIDGVAAPEEELIILEIPQVNPDDYHYGGAIRFGPDGMLYLGIGDGHFYTWAQDLDSLFGTIIRIDVRGASAEQPYKAPDDNPFVGTPDARPEIWAYGMRNPWRMAFDPRDGRLWVGDVGGDLQEEINIVTAGANLGWPILEGTACFWVNPCDELEGATPPIVTYDQTRQRCAVIGGVVYRGSAIPWLDGVYLFGDFCGGRIWALDHDADMGWRMIEIADLPLPVSSFGTDAAGNVYVLTFAGPILRLVEADSGYATLPVSVAPSKTFTPPATPISGADEAE